VDIAQPFTGIEDTFGNDVRRMQPQKPGVRRLRQKHLAQLRYQCIGMGQRQSDLGLTVPDFPNLFVMLGPNSGPAHGGSVIFQSECQSRYIRACLIEMIEQDFAAIDVRPDAHDQYISKVDAEHEQLIWTHPGMTTYYRNGQGRVFSTMPWRFVDDWAMTYDPDLSQYRHTKM
jgi:hypothetical protein